LLVAFWRGWFQREKIEEALEVVPQESGRLRRVTLYEFETGQLRGYLSGMGANPGITITAGADGKPITPSGSSMMTLSHYLCSSNIGPYAPLKAEDRRQELHGDSLVVRFAATPHWPLEATVCYTLCEEGRIDTIFHFNFQADFPAFEAQVVSTFTDTAGVSNLHVDGNWFRPALAGKDISFFARDRFAEAMVQDGRWDFNVIEGYRVLLDDRGYDYPILVSLEEKSGWALVQMCLIDECPSVALCSTPRQHNFSLVGRGVKQGESLTCHTRVAYGQFRGLEGILPLYHQFVREVREGRIQLPEEALGEPI
jgi:hypothetical protein